mgnify:CR=1 FL=1
MRNAEDIKRMIVDRRNTWGMIDWDGNQIPYDIEQPYKLASDPTWKFSRFYPWNGSVENWIRDLKKYQAEIKSGTLIIEGETVETLQADIDQFKRQIKDCSAYEKFQKENDFSIGRSSSDDDDDEEEDEDED